MVEGEKPWNEDGLTLRSGSDTAFITTLNVRNSKFLVRTFVVYCSESQKLEFLTRHPGIFKQF